MRLRLAIPVLATTLGVAAVSCAAPSAQSHRPQADAQADAPPPATAPAEDERPREKVTIRDRVYRLELSDDPESRARGLSGRTTIGADEGMLFAYPSPRPLSFWMKDCLVDMDIAYLDHEGRITATYTMRLERPRREDESLWAYESRLRRYASRRRAQFVIELRAGTIKELELRVGEVIALDVPRLEAQAR